MGGLVALVPLLALAQPPAPTVKDVTVEGNRRVQEAVILGRVQTAAGSPFIPARLADDLRAIFALGFFDDVRMRVEDFEGGVKITFVVIERPFVRDVAFVGNKKIDVAVLQEKIDLKLGSVFNPVEVQKAVQALKDHYEEEGYFEVRISPDIERFADGDVRVLFRIAEGRVIKIDKIVIRGNQGLSDRKIKAVLGTQEREYFILRGKVHRQRLEEDVERILQLYNDHGYIQARVESHDLAVDEERARVTVTFTVVEGPQFRVGKVDVTGASVLPEPEVRRPIKLKPGEEFSRTKLRESVEGVTRLYSTIGKASVEVNPQLAQNSAERTVDVTFEISEGPDVFVERINVTGNVRSEEKILRREIPFEEGDLFTSNKLDRARQRLNNLGYFQSVKASTTPGADKTKIIVNVEVVEKPTGVFSLGGGFSSVDSFVGTIDLSQRNFLGRGWEVAIRFRGGAVAQQGSISFTEPWLFDQPIAAGFDLFDTRRDFQEFQFESLGMNLRMSRPFLDFARWFVGYRLTRDTISDLTDVARETLESEEGTRVTSAISGSLSRDTRDSNISPTRGNFATIAAEFAGLGGDSKFFKITGSMSHFLPLWFGHILAGRAEAAHIFGYGGEEVPLFERFFLGGPSSIRSFKFRQVSPVDARGIRTGGDIQVLGNLEYLIPIPLPFGDVRIGPFFDIGNVYGFGERFDLTNTREAAGVTFRWNSPFGPIRVDYGINLDRRDGEKFGNFHFSVGSPF